MRFAVTGGRTFGVIGDPYDAAAVWKGTSERALIYKALDSLPRHAVLLHGGAQGADYYASQHWAGLGRKTEVHPAKWKEHGKAAGPKRNQEMVDSGIELLLAFSGGTGTADCVKRARKAGIKVVEVGK